MGHWTTSSPPRADTQCPTLVGLLVKITRNAERFWVSVTDAGNGGWHVGTVDNDLVCAHPYGRGDLVEFHSDEVVDVFED